MRPAGRALLRRSLADARVRTASFAFLFAAVAVANVAGYRKTYPTPAERLRLAAGFGGNKALRLFYGEPHDLATLGGYASWRIGGTLALFAAFFGLLSAVRALRGEEDSGRQEIAAAGAITRGGAVAARLAAIALTIGALWLADLAGLAGGGLPLGGSAYLALATATVAAVYAAIGALASQLMPTRRSALELAGAVFGVDFLLRIVADTAGEPWLHWAGPLGWAEELQPFAGPQPLVLLLPVAAAAGLLAAALALDRRRDLGGATFKPHDDARPRLALLRSPLLLALRSERIGLSVWALATGGAALVVGSLSKSVAAAFTPAIRKELKRIGELQVATPAGYIGLTFLIFVFATSLFCCSQIAAVRSEEAEGRLETLFALPHGRTRWLTGRVLLAAGGAVLICVLVGLGSAAGARIVGARVAVGRLLEAGLNCLPASMLFLGLGLACVAVAPRIGAGLAYGLVSAAFVWELFGALLAAPPWLLGVSPFHHVGLIPAQPFRPAAAAAMLGIGVASALAGIGLFRRRDLAGA
jgi:polyether ionophore transport system permease protein